MQKLGFLIGLVFTGTGTSFSIASWLDLLPKVISLIGGLIMAISGVVVIAVNYYRMKTMKIESQIKQLELKKLENEQ